MVEDRARGGGMGKVMIESRQQGFAFTPELVPLAPQQREPASSPPHELHDVPGRPTSFYLGSTGLEI